MGPPLDHTILVGPIHLVDHQRRARWLIVPLNDNTFRHKRDHNRICVLIICPECVLSDLSVSPRAPRILPVGDIAQDITMSNDDNFALLSLA